MSANEEIGESHARIVCNGSSTRINDIGLQLYPVSNYDSSEGLPYAPVDWPNTGDKGADRKGKKIKIKEPLNIYICIFRSVFRL